VSIWRRRLVLRLRLLGACADSTLLRGGQHASVVDVCKGGMPRPCCDRGPAHGPLTSSCAPAESAAGSHHCCPGRLRGLPNCGHPARGVTSSRPGAKREHAPARACSARGPTCGRPLACGSRVRVGTDVGHRSFHIHRRLRRALWAQLLLRSARGTRAASERPCCICALWPAGEAVEACWPFRLSAAAGRWRSGTWRLCNALRPHPSLQHDGDRLMDAKLAKILCVCMNASGHCERDPTPAAAVNRGPADWLKRVG
jgi:hypothetical protein